MIQQQGACAINPERGHPNQAGNIRFGLSQHVRLDPSLQLALGILERAKIFLPNPLSLPSHGTAPPNIRTRSSMLCTNRPTSSNWCTREWFSARGRWRCGMNRADIPFNGTIGGGRPCFFASVAGVLDEEGEELVDCGHGTSVPAADLLS